MADLTASQGGSNSQSQDSKAASPAEALPRGLGFFAVLVFGVGCIGLASSGMLPFSAISGAFPGVDLPLVLTIAMLLSIFPAFTYAVMGTFAPRAAADYFIASRVLSKPLAFASSFTFVIFSALVAGSLIAEIPQKVVPFFLRIFAMMNSPVQGLSSMADSIGASNNTVLIGTILVIVIFLLLLLPQRIILRTLQVGFGLGLLSYGILYFQLVSAPVLGFQEAWNRVLGSGAFLDHLMQAKAFGMTPQVADYGTLTAAGMLLGFWVFFGYMIPTFFAGEVKRPERNLIAGSLTSLVLTWGLFVGASLLLLRLVPAEWLSAESYLYQSKEFLGLAMPWLPFYAAVSQPNLILVLIVFLCWLYTLINLAQIYFYFCSRILLAWAEDDVLPASTGSIHPALKSPVITVLLVASVAEFGVVDAALGSPMAANMNLIFFLALTQIIPVLAVTLLPFRKKSWFESSSKFARLKVGRLPIITFVGILTLLYLVSLVVVSMAYPVMGGISLSTVFIFAGFFVFGLIWYFVRRFYVSRQAHPTSQATLVRPAG